MVIVRVSYGYGYTRGSGRVRVAILGTGRVRVRVSTAATGTGRVAKMVDPHTSISHSPRANRFTNGRQKSLIASQFMV